jgi:hypothetical protein
MYGGGSGVEINSIPNEKTEVLIRIDRRGGN